jgi:hypothetical protein
MVEQQLLELVRKRDRTLEPTSLRRREVQLADEPLQRLADPQDRATPGPDGDVARQQVLPDGVFERAPEYRVSMSDRP